MATKDDRFARRFERGLPPGWKAKELTGACAGSARLSDAEGLTRYVGPEDGAWAYLRGYMACADDTAERLQALIDR